MLVANCFALPFTVDSFMAAYKEENPFTQQKWIQDTVYKGTDYSILPDRALSQ